MNVNLLPFAVVWAVLATIVIILIVYRRRVARQEDDTLHVMQAATISQQATVAQKLEQIDKWGKLLTALAVIYGLGIAAAYVYQAFVRSSQIPVG